MAKKISLFLLLFLSGKVIASEPEKVKKVQIIESANQVKLVERYIDANEVGDMLTKLDVIALRLPSAEHREYKKTRAQTFDLLFRAAQLSPHQHQVHIPDIDTSGLAFKKELKMLGTAASTMVSILFFYFLYSQMYSKI